MGSAEVSVNDCVRLLGLKNHRTKEAKKGGRPSFRDRLLIDFHKDLVRLVEDVFSNRRQVIGAECRYNPGFLQEEAERLLVDRGYGPTIWGPKDRVHLMQAGAEGYPKDLHFDNDSDRRIIKETTRLWLVRSVRNKVKNDYPKRPSGSSMMEEDEVYDDDGSDTDNTVRVPLSNADANANLFRAPAAPMYPQGENQAEPSQHTHNASYFDETFGDMSPQYPIDDDNDPSYVPHRGMSAIPGIWGKGPSPKRKRASGGKSSGGRSKKQANSNRATNHARPGEPSSGALSLPLAPEATIEASPSMSIEAMNHVENYLTGQNHFARSHGQDYDHTHQEISGLPVVEPRPLPHDDHDSVMASEIEASQEHHLDEHARELGLDNLEAGSATPVTSPPPLSNGTTPDETPPEQQSHEFSGEEESSGQEVGPANPVTLPRRVPPSHRTHSAETLQILVEITKTGTPSSDIITMFDIELNSEEFENINRPVGHLNATKNGYAHWIDMHRELAAFQDATGYKGRIEDLWDPKWAEALKALSNLSRWATRTQVDGTWMDKDVLDLELATYLSAFLQLPGLTPQALLSLAGLELYNEGLLKWFTD